MSRPLHWWIAAGIIAAGLIFHAAFPRYEWRSASSPNRLIRIDRWTGRAELGYVIPARGEWTPIKPQ